MKGKKCFGVLLLLFIIFGVSLNVSSVYADSLGTSSFDFEYRTQNGDYTWANGLLYNQNVTNQIVRYARKYQFNTASVTPTGNNAVVHFETNIVFSDYNSNAPYPMPFVNRDMMTIGCNAYNTSLQVNGSSLSTVTTVWYENNYTNVTLTVYGDVALTGFIKNTPTNIVCAVGSSNFAFMDITPSRLYHSIYFEKNPINIMFTDSVTDNLLQQQIGQTQQMIQQNQQIIQQNQEIIDSINNLNNSQAQRDQQDRDDLEDASDDASSGANSAQSQAQSAGTTLLKAFSDFVGAITNASASDCIIDADMGNLDLGEIDLCQLALPQPFQVLASLTVIGFCVPLSIATAKKLIALIRSFQ